MYGTVFSFFIATPIKTFRMHQVNTISVPASLNAKIIPNRYANQPMADKEQPRSIRFPQKLWDAIDRDAQRSKRSAVKQMEAILSMYYRLANTELNAPVLEVVRVRSQTQ